MVLNHDGLDIRSVFIQACSEGNLDVVKYLLLCNEVEISEGYSDRDGRDIDTQTIQNGCDVCVKYSGIVVVGFMMVRDCINKEDPVYRWVTGKQHLEVIEHLIDNYEVDVNDTRLLSICDYVGNTSLAGKLTQIIDT